MRLGAASNCSLNGNHLAVINAAVIESRAPSRRFLLKLAVASAGFAAVSGPALALPSDDAVIAVAKAGLQRAGARILRRDVVGVADFGRQSRDPRLYLVDLVGGRVETLLVAHGRGSDPEHTGWLHSFSNEPGSDATSEGAFLVGDEYIGKHGRSMRLVGLDPTNSNAEARGIVVHSAAYVGPQMIRTFGMLGRSEGCFAVSDSDLPKVLDRLGPGRLLVSVKI